MNSVSRLKLVEARSVVSGLGCERVGVGDGTGGRTALGRRPEIFENLKVLWVDRIKHEQQLQTTKTSFCKSPSTRYKLAFGHIIL